jgi:hypothetical protein
MLSNVIYILESPFSLINEGKYQQKELYLDTQKDIVHDGKEVIVNCPLLFSTNIRIFEINSTNNIIDCKTEYSLLVSKTITPSFSIWHQRLLHTSNETVLQTIKAIGIEVKKPQNWSCKMYILAKLFKQISRDTLFQSTEACAELYTDTITVKP